MEKAWFYDKRFTKTYILKYSPKFLKDHSIVPEKLQEDILHYLENYYFTKQEKYFKVFMNKNLSLWYHKIETQLPGQSRRHGGRTLAFFIFHDDNNNAYITPAFFFPVQEEKIYTTNKLTSPQFGSKLMQKLNSFDSDEMKEGIIWKPVAL